MTCEACKLTGEDLIICDIRLKQYYVYGKECPREKLLKNQNQTPPREFQMVPVDAILTMPFQSRLEFDKDGIEELAKSIKIHGVLEPLLIRSNPEGYQLVAGERRLRAAKKAGLTMVPCLVRQLSDQEAFEVHLIENDQRQDLSDYERGRMYSEMLRHFPEDYPTQVALGQKVGRTKQYVSYHIQHYKFVEETKAKVPSDLSTRVDKLPERTTREIQRAPLEKQAGITEDVIQDELSVQETKELVDIITGKVDEGEGSDNQEEPSLHVKHTPKPIPCPTCNSDLAILSKTRDFNPEKSWLQCPLCGRRLDLPENIKNYLATLQPPPPPPPSTIPCPVCSTKIKAETYEKLKVKFASFTGLFEG